MFGRRRPKVDASCKILEQNYMLKLGLGLSFDPRGIFCGISLCLTSNQEFEIKSLFHLLDSVPGTIFLSKAVTCLRSRSLVKLARSFLPYRQYQALTFCSLCWEGLIWHISSAASAVRNRPAL
jgi:hypothetical protein